MPSINTFWYLHKNFGDNLTPALLRHFGYTPRFARPAYADIVAVGSLLQKFPAHYRGIIAGTGFMYGNSPRELPNATILALRGALTHERVPGSKPLVLGDPGLLAPLLMTNRPPATYELGLIPHYTDKANEQWRLLAQKFPEQVQLIDVEAPLLQVMENIARCKTIISSSLHGLVTADALGIPNRWHDVASVSGHGFKFHDYYSAFAETRTPLPWRGNETWQELASATLAPPKTLPSVTSQLHDVFSQLSAHLAQLPPEPSPAAVKYVINRVYYWLGRS